jgi:hypothetical protein
LGLQKSMDASIADRSDGRKAVRHRDRSSVRRFVRVNDEVEREEACEGSRSKKVRCKRDAVRAASRGCCFGEEPKPHRWNAFGDRTARRLKQATRARSRGEIGRDSDERRGTTLRREIRGATQHGLDGDERERSERRLCSLSRKARRVSSGRRRRSALEAFRRAGIDAGLRRNAEAEAVRVKYPAHPEKWRR